MSSQKGNVQRKRQQKYRNTTAFKNSMHDNSHRMRDINALVPTGLCTRCKDKIDWKIKYRKYKPLSQPRKCVRCDQKTVIRAYYTVCSVCAGSHDICQKCGKKEELVMKPDCDKRKLAAEAEELQQEIKLMSERQRRTFFRQQEQGKLDQDKLDSDDDPQPNSSAADLNPLDSDNDIVSSEASSHEDKSESDIDSSNDGTNYTGIYTGGHDKCLSEVAEAASTEGVDAKLMALHIKANEDR